MLQISRRNLLASSAAVAVAIGPSASGKVVRKAMAGTNLPVQLSLNNLDSANSYASPNVSYGHAFADGDIPATGSVAITDSNGNPVVAQMDAVARWPSGCPRFVVLSHACAETFEPGQSLSYSIGSSTNPPDNTPASVWGSSPEATMAANSDISVEYSGFDARRDTYTVSLNTILSTYRQYPWGTNNPRGGWERAKVGPACIEWHAWQYIANDRTSRPQGYVRCDMWVKAWSPTGPFEIDVRTSQPNMWNAITPHSEMYNQSPGRWATVCTIRNGSQVLSNQGGPSDLRAITIPGNAFNLTTKQIKSPQYGIFPQQGVVFSSTGTLPDGLKPGAIYWLAYPTANAYICTQRLFASMLEIAETSTWAPNTTYSLGQVVFNDAAYYLCNQAGTSGTSGGPSGIGKGIVDGTCKWKNVTIPFTTQGTGEISAYPVNVCFPSSAWMTGDLYGNPLWYGAAGRPPVFPGHDFSYLTSKTKFVPCYNANAGCKESRRKPHIYAPNQMYGGVYWYQDVTGDDPSDQRIGYVDGWGVASIFNPVDPYYLFASIQTALCYNNAAFSYMTDERGGMPFCGNNGHNNNGKAYRHLPSLIPTWESNGVASCPSAFGVGNWLPWSTSNKNRSGDSVQYYIDTSHTPASWQVPYLKTGRPCFLDQGIHQGNTNSFMQYGAFATLGTKSFYSVINSVNGVLQERAWAWALRTLCQSLYVTPATHAFQPVLADYYNDNAAYVATYYTSYVPPAANKFGWPYVLDHADQSHGGIAAWEHSFLLTGIAMEAWRGGLTGATSGRNWNTFLTYLNGYWKIYAPKLPESVYYFGLYTIVYGPDPQDLSTAYQSAGDVLTATATSGLNGGLNMPYPATGIWDGYLNNCLFAADFEENPSSYTIQVRAALAMCHIADPGNKQIRLLRTAIDDAISVATNISVKKGGIEWCGKDGEGEIQNFQTFAIF